MGKEMLITRNRNLKIGIYYFVKVRKILKFYLVLLSLLYTWVWVTEEKTVGWLIAVDIQKFGVTFGVWSDKHFN